MERRSEHDGESGKLRRVARRKKPARQGDLIPNGEWRDDAALMLFLVLMYRLHFEKLSSSIMIASGQEEDGGRAGEAEKTFTAQIKLADMMEEKHLEINFFCW